MSQDSDSRGEERRLVALLAELHHELGTPLTVLSNHLSVTQLELAAAASSLPRHDDARHDAEDAADRLEGLLRELRVAARTLAEPWRPQDVRAILLEAIDKFEDAHDSPVSLRIRPDLPPILAREGAVQLLVERLLIDLRAHGANALQVEAVEEGREVVVSLRSQEPGGREESGTGNLFLPSFLAIIHGAHLQRTVAADGAALFVLRLTCEPGASFASSTSSRTAQNGLVMGDTRFDHAWERWVSLEADERVAFLASEETGVLIELLASTAGKENDRDRNVIATALLNRLTASGVADAEQATSRLLADARRRRRDAQVRFDAARDLIASAKAQSQDGRRLLE